MYRIIFLSDHRKEILAGQKRLKFWVKFNFVLKTPPFFQLKIFFFDRRLLYLQYLLVKVLVLGFFHREELSYLTPA